MWPKWLGCLYTYFDDFLTKNGKKTSLLKSMVQALNFNEPFRPEEMVDRKICLGGFLFQNESKNTFESVLNHLYAISALAEMKMCRHFYDKNIVKSA